jgi:hypothetical protein
MKPILLALLLIVSPAVPPAASEEAPEAVGTWEIATAIAGANAAVWQVNTRTGERRLCQLTQVRDESAIACTGWIRTSERVIQSNK